MIASTEPVLERSRLALLYNISRDLVSELELPELLRRILHVTVEAVGAVTGSIVLVGNQQQVVDAVLLVNGRIVADVQPQMEPLARQGLAGWVLRNRKSTIVPNTSEDPRWLATEATAEAGPRAVVAAPLLASGRLLGVMTISHDLPGYFGESDQELLEAIADQAAIAVENARLYAAEQRRRRLSDTLQEVTRTINATLELDHVLALILEQLARVVHYDRSAILLRSEGQLQVQAALGYADPEAVLKLTFDAGEGMPGQVLQERRPVVVVDVHADDAWQRDGLPDAESICSWLGAPLIATNDVIGVLTVESHEPGTYGPEDTQAVASFAEHAATAVVNARLFEASRQQAQAMAAVAETARILSATLNPDEVLESLASQVMSVLNVEATSIALLDSAEGDLVFRVAKGAVAEDIMGVRLPMGQGIAGWVAKSGKGVLVPETEVDARFYPEIDRMTGFNTRSILCAPVQLKGHTVGVIEAINPIYDSFEVSDLQMLNSMANLAGTALAHAQEFTTTQAAEQHYAGLFEDSIDPILLSDLEGQITDVNHKAAETFGYQREELIKRSVNDIHTVEKGDLLDQLEQLASGGDVAFQAWAVTSDGHEIPVEIHAKQIVAGDSELIQWIERDLSERAAMEEMRADLISMIFHDLRSPLGNIISSLDVLEVSVPPDDDAIHSVLKIAARSAARLSRMVDSLLDLRRLEAGQAVLQKVEASVDTLIAEAAEQVHPMAEGKDILLRFDLLSRMPPVDMDVDMIRRVIINLMENAVKYTPAGGQLFVSGSADANEIVVSIADTGPGIPQEEQARIFEKFARVQREGAPKGLGLGLAFCKMAVEAHGGRIWTTSQPGKGAVFNFTLPLRHD